VISKKISRYKIAIERISELITMCDLSAVVTQVFMKTGVGEM